MGRPSSSGFSERAREARTLTFGFADARSPGDENSLRRRMGSRGSLLLEPLEVRLQQVPHLGRTEYVDTKLTA